MRDKVEVSPILTYLALLWMPLVVPYEQVNEHDEQISLSILLPL